MEAASDEVRHAARVLTKEELTSRLLALVLTAVLVWHTVLIPPTLHAHARRTRRPSHGGEERGAESRRGELLKGASSDAVESVDDMDWPEFICMD
ncbi:MAG TPA: hypothetical protein VEX60_18840 [Pyrinomonadaceae bacterium]|nr:hypothetical protein [Pyrinomonadaceae bacterium]